MRFTKLNGNEIVKRGRFTNDETALIKTQLENIISERFSDIPITTVGRDKNFFIRQMMKATKYKCVEVDDKYDDKLSDMLEDEFGNDCIIYFIKLTEDYIKNLKSKLTLKAKHVKAPKKNTKSKL